MTSGWLNGGIIVRPSSRAMASARSPCSGERVAPTRTTSPPWRRTPSIFTAGVDSGMTTTARSPKRRAANATAWPWLPLDWVTTPRTDPPPATRATAL